MSTPGSLRRWHARAPRAGRRPPSPRRLGALRRTPAPRRRRRGSARGARREGLAAELRQLESVVGPPVGRAHERPRDLRALLKELARDREEHPRTVGGLDEQDGAPVLVDRRRSARRRAVRAGGTARRCVTQSPRPRPFPRGWRSAPRPPSAPRRPRWRRCRTTPARRTQRKSTASTSPPDRDAREDQRRDDVEPVRDERGGDGREEARAILRHDAQRRAPVGQGAPDLGVRGPLAPAVRDRARACGWRADRRARRSASASTPRRPPTTAGRAGRRRLPVGPAPSRSRPAMT